jgi:hypothetical protein
MHHFSRVCTPDHCTVIYLIDLTRGGNSATDKITGKISLIEDQTLSSPSCAALVNSWKTKEPIVLIAGSGYELLPFNIKPKEYVVLGYYIISHAWGLFRYEVLESLCSLTSFLCFVRGTRTLIN